MVRDLNVVTATCGNGGGCEAPHDKFLPQLIKKAVLNGQANIVLESGATYYSDETLELSGLPEGFFINGNGALVIVKTTV